MSRRAGVRLVGIAVLVSGCATVKQVPRQADAPAPQVKATRVDFTPLFSENFASNSVYVEPHDTNLMKRVLLSPNLVFESSRSSLKEPKTVGPANAGSDSPDLPDALGLPVSTNASSVLMRYLVAHGSSMIAPLASTLWDAKAFCTATGCPERTWLERMMAVYHASEKPSSDLPSAMLAVRHLGMGWRSVSVLVQQASNGDIVVVPRRYAAEQTACPDLKLELPVVWFSAELVSLRDGHILARIDEARVPRVSSTDLSRMVVATTYEPVRATGYTETDDGIPAPGSSYSYVSGYTAKPVLCQQATAAYREIQDGVMRTTDVQSMMTSLLSSTLDPLYR